MRTPSFCVAPNRGSCYNQENDFSYTESFVKGGQMDADSDD